ncbi:MAG TPA: sigma-70 family RNA polymerase sigma factor [Thermoleophilia bacterium]|nr:sigma-70 family RNA polymerase sigma factor [Thermoleophilia bacterium]
MSRTVERITKEEGRETDDRATTDLLTADENHRPERGGGAGDGGRGAVEMTARLSYTSPEAVFRAHYAPLVRALGFAWGDTEAAADAVQEAFAQLLVRWNRVSSYDDPPAWVRRVAINRLRSRRRALLRRAAVLIRLSRQTETVAQPPNPPDELTAALRSLSERQRTATALHYIGGLTVVEVAEAMGISPGAVNQHLHRARAALRTTMEAKR